MDRTAFPFRYLFGHEGAILVIGIRFQDTKLQILHGITNEVPCYFKGFEKSFWKVMNISPQLRKVGLITLAFIGEFTVLNVLNIL